MKCLSCDAIVLAVFGIVLVSPLALPPGLSGMQDLPAQSSAHVPLSPPMDAAPASDDEWRGHGRDLGEQRYSPLDQISTINVDRLGIAWTYDIPRRGARLEATPIVVDGVMYATGPMSTVLSVTPEPAVGAAQLAGEAGGCTGFNSTGRNPVAWTVLPLMLCLLYRR